MNWTHFIWCLQASACPCVAVGLNTYNGAVPLREKQCTREIGGIWTGVMHAMLCFLLPYATATWTYSCCGIYIGVPLGCCVHAPVRRYAYRYGSTDSGIEPRPH